MARRQKKYHYIYKTTNLLSGKYYIGMHSTDDLDDGYMGSGNRLRLAIRKHGKENFKREIIEFVESRVELKLREAEIITLDEIAKEDCMNLKVGGEGGWSKTANNKFKWLLENDSDFRESISKQTTEHNIRLHKEGVLTKPNYDWNGKNHTEESKLKMSESKKGKYCGEENSVYGRKWMYKEGVKSKMVKKEEIDIHLNNGWLFGKKNKK